MNIIEVENLFKEFTIPHIKRNSFRENFINRFRKGEYEKFHALYDVSFSVKEGEFLAVIGNNGSGKSTLLKILAGVYLPTSGKVVVNANVAPFLELGVGFNYELSGRDNVFLNGTILGLTERQIADRYTDIVAFSELERFMDQKLKNFSSGMCMRLAFSIAIESDARILLLDEVLTVGDTGFQEKCFKKFEEFKAEGRTVIFVSHDSVLIDKICDNTLLLENGNVIHNCQTTQF